MGSGDEIVAIVDASNHVIGSSSRREMRARRLLHRACFILVFNSSGDLFVQKRTMSKDVYPGYFDTAVGGVVMAGESYEQSAKRELWEELGIQCITLTAHLDFHFDDDHSCV